MPSFEKSRVHWVGLELKVVVVVGRPGWLLPCVLTLMLALARAGE